MQCDACGKPDATNKCSRCKKARYCSKECQKKAWRDHKPSCYTPKEQKLMRKVAKETTVKACNVCSKTRISTGKRLHHCPCKLVRYCSVECQKKDWPEHRKVCPCDTTKKKNAKKATAPKKKQLNAQQLECQK